MMKNWPTTPAPLSAFSTAPTLSRRRWLALAAGGYAASAVPGAQAMPLRPLQFPRDFGSHPDLRTEWWYITGQVQAAGQRWGFQVTFFRSRVDVAQGMQSAFAAKQLLFAHAALTDLRAGKLYHDQRIARAGFGVARASEADTDIRLQDWSLRRTDLAGAVANASRNSTDHGTGTSASAAPSPAAATPRRSPRPVLRSIWNATPRSRCCCKASRACRAKGQTPRRPATTTASRRWPCAAAWCWAGSAWP